jgi:hypothetical protein
MGGATVPVVSQTWTGAFCSEGRFDQGEALPAVFVADLGKAHEGQDRENNDDQPDEIDDVVHLRFPYGVGVSRGR